MRYNVGDKVKIKDDLEIGYAYGDKNYVAGMDIFKKFTDGFVVISECGNGFYKLENDNCQYSWTDEMLEPATTKSKLSEILGVEDEEVFKIKEDVGYINDFEYRVSKDGYLEYFNNEYNEWLTLKVYLYYKCLISGEYTIVRTPVLTKEELDTLNYYARKGYHWFAREKDGTLYAYKYDVKKSDDVWIGNSVFDFSRIDEEKLDFISWEDEEPFYWEGKTNEI